MILPSLVLAGLAAGISGLVIGLQARARSARVVAECAQMLRRQLQVASGDADHRAVRDLAIVHYDALKEGSTGLSFSLAMLNAGGDGIVLTSINGRTETRTYAKVIECGRGVETLSPEEEQALRAARLGKGPQVRLDDPLDVPPAPVNGYAPTGLIG